MRFAPFALVLSLFAQSAPLSPPTPAEFGQWERLATIPDRGGLSPDGRWLAYGINRTNGDNDLRVTSVADGSTRTIAFGAQPVFSATRKSISSWIAVFVALTRSSSVPMLM